MSEWLFDNTRDQARNAVSPWLLDKNRDKPRNAVSRSLLGKNRGQARRAEAGKPRAPALGDGDSQSVKPCRGEAAFTARIPSGEPEAGAGGAQAKPKFSPGATRATPGARAVFGRCCLAACGVMAAPVAACAAEIHVPPVRLWMATPFVLLLAAIALGPFVHRQWWEKHYPKVSLGLGFLVLSYYCLQLDYRRMATAGHEYFSFITLIGSLFVASGGIYLHAERLATPLTNALLLGVGALVSNLLGTTGASMLLIRPFIRINRPRIRGFHVVFFIFIVSNIGGALTPIGDPPLFLGYLNGVPFHWTLFKLWPAWLTGTGLVLALFFALDSIAYRRWRRAGHAAAKGSRLEVRGTQNFIFLLIILVAVFARTPVRELIMAAAAAAAHRFARKEALRANEFTFTPIREVAILFAGIFATMVPALDWLALNAHVLGVDRPGQFYWATGVLSSVLDNAPTYLNFLSAAMGLHGLMLGSHEHMQVLIATHGKFLEAISIGAVFFGANTYIGNGPNFMVKSIAEHAGVECPTFVGYVVRYSLPVLFPVFTAVWWLFFR